MQFHCKIHEDTLRELEAGGGSVFELSSNFLRTQAGTLSADEILLLVYQAFHDKPFTITVNLSDVDPQTSLLHREYVTDLLRASQ